MQMRRMLAGSMATQPRPRLNQILIRCQTRQSQLKAILACQHSKPCHGLRQNIRTTASGTSLPNPARPHRPQRSTACTAMTCMSRPRQHHLHNSMCLRIRATSSNRSSFPRTGLRALRLPVRPHQRPQQPLLQERSPRPMCPGRAAGRWWGMHRQAGRPSAACCRSPQTLTGLQAPARAARRLPQRFPRLLSQATAQPAAPLGSYGCH